jgi:hypothetical protein
MWASACDWPARKAGWRFAVGEEPTICASAASASDARLSRSRTIRSAEYRQLLGELPATGHNRWGEIEDAPSRS